jgi:UPF0755 protein
MNKFKIAGISLFIIALIGLVISQSYFTSNTNFTEDKKYLFIKTGSTYDDVLQSLQKENIIEDINSFKSIASKLSYGKTIKPGRYKITNGMSSYSLVKKLRSGNQDAVQLVLKKYRLKQDLAKHISSKLEADSASIMQILNDNAYLASWNLDSISSIAAFTPNTYEFYWNSDAKKIFEKVAKAYQKIWNESNLSKAKNIGLTPAQVMTLASIVDEETQADAEKGNVASVYLNRLKNGMKLQADPTVKYALGDFAIRRVLLKHLANPSPYNTYFVNGLPPGPICTPRLESIESVLNAPKTNYLFFCASPDKIGYHNFAATDAEHLANAGKFQEWLDKRGIKK